MKECSKKLLLSERNCCEKGCHLWIDYPEDSNCTLIAAHKNGPMTLREVSERLGISIVRVKQIADEAVEKIKSVVITGGY